MVFAELMQGILLVGGAREGWGRSGGGAGGRLCCQDAGQNQRLMANNGNSINSFHLCPHVGCVAESVVTSFSRSE